jgi:hypothetical protein
VFRVCLSCLNSVSLHPIDLRVEATDYPPHARPGEALHHSPPPRVLSTIPASSTTPRPPQPRVLHNPPRYKAILPSHMCSECLCFGYVYPASTLSVCIRLTWGLKEQITHLKLNPMLLSATSRYLDATIARLA